MNRRMIAARGGDAQSLSTARVEIILREPTGCARAARVVARTLCFEFSN
jgi:hypothetical protein